MRFRLGLQHASGHVYTVGCDYETEGQARRAVQIANDVRRQSCRSEFTHLVGLDAHRKRVIVRPLTVHREKEFIA